jgi:hypothetical protein
LSKWIKRPTLAGRYDIALLTVNAASWAKRENHTNMNIASVLKSVAPFLRDCSRCRQFGGVRAAPLVLMAFVVVSLAGCNREPFQRVRVSGTVAYEDGSPIPVEVLRLTFTPQAPPLDDKTHPRPGWAEADTATGAFNSATTRKVGDGLVRGKHKVTLSGAGSSRLPRSLVPPEYQDYAQTPLEVDTDHQPFELKVRKPRR